ncbi:DEAD/DEAH box helicase family protein [Gemmata obscuriglobus]|uniref:DEAD/DEAH box helicase family protein n=1 Tax=Gemmata obscuriglobus TaxID=114 RepID=UPI00137B9FCA|nr:DEAD/DEAH box helicase family protein [Gemmata obscuriglobus]VTS08171.1 dead box family phage associated protein : : ResIII [Gemmata obscuriglobus UQM 2246]
MITTRPYQKQSVDRVFGRFDAGEPSTLVILPTGCGKTVVFGLVSQQWARECRPGRCWCSPTGTS